MTAKTPVQYTVRGVPREIEASRKAHVRKISLNQILLEELTNAAGITVDRRYRSVKSIAGKWKDDPAFDRALEEQRRIDPDLWWGRSSSTRIA